MKRPDQICFSHKYTKLGKPEFTTVRWLDKEYRLGGLYEVYLIAQNQFHNRYGRGVYRIVGLEIKKLRELTDEFIRADADCDRGAFMVLMESWYRKKPGWKGEDSEAQVLHLKAVELGRRVEDRAGSG